MLQLLSHQVCPVNFKEHFYEKSFQIPLSEEQIWLWLNNPETFTKSQIWPFRVEFVLGPDQQHGFETGVFNAHHGPLMNFAGIIGEVNPHYRDLKYLYGSYFLSFRWIRPHRLEFWTEAGAQATTLKLRLCTYVHPRFFGFWHWAQGIFWSGFGSKVGK